jgi:AraC-like DNA-binding protein
MPISSQLREAPSERSMPPAANPTSAQTSTSTGILLLERDLVTLSNWTKLLTNSRYVVTTARSQSDLFALRETTGVSLVILSDRLGTVALSAATRLIRLQWPSARILVLGRAQSVLEGNLYDEAIEHPVVDSDLLRAIQRVCPSSSSQIRERGPFILRRGAIETTATSSIEGSEDPLTFLRNSTFDCIHNYLPRDALNAFTDEVGWPRIDTLRCPNGATDQVIMPHLAKIILPMFGKPETICQPYLKHYLAMLCAYVALTYGTARIPSDQSKGGLAPWQRRWLIDVFASDPKGESGLTMLARGCGLSTSHFARCFKKSFGVPVHRYIIQQRIAVAKRMLLSPGPSLTEVALDTGFADQAAFGRTFATLVGSTPAKWRKEQLYSHGARSAVGKLESRA